MKITSKFSSIALAIFTAVMIGAAEGELIKPESHENVVDAALNGKLKDLAHNIKMQQAGPNEAADMFKAAFPGPMEGSAKVKKIWFEDGNTSLVITDSPIPIKIFLKGQFLMDNDQLTAKVGNVIKFKVSSLELAEEPVLETLRVPYTDSPYWIYATFSSYGKGNDADNIDNLKPGTIPY
jgi:hypothetical protein